MYRFIGDQTAYSFFNTLSLIVTLVASLFLFPLKRDVIGLHSKRIIHSISRSNETIGTVAKYVLISVESLLMAGILLFSTSYNMQFGELVGTGGNYFASLFLVSPLWFVMSLVLMTSPLKQIDIATLLAPVFLFVVKIACFCNGCCWGIPWEHGLYNDNFNHPGKQVPVQAFEAFFALVILVFLLLYRKKAKTGTLFPMYMILYSATRFPVEFFSAAHEKIAGPFNTYHFLCIAGVIIGFILLLCVKLFGEKITSLFEKPHEKLNLKIAEQEEKKMLKLAEEKAQAETAEKERLEKVRLAREKAKARRKK